MNQWYDTNLNPIEPPSFDEQTYICIQKPHTRTIKFRTEFGVVVKRLKFPWIVFVFKKRFLQVAMSMDMPTLDSTLLLMYLPNIYTYGVCLSEMPDEDKNAPQDYIDYFWQSEFNSIELFVDNYQAYFKDPSCFSKNKITSLKELIPFTERIEIIYSTNHL